MAHEIHKVSVRNALDARREPYWGAPLSEGRYLGVRKLDNGTCTWVVRLRDEEGKQRYRALGQISDKNDHSAAKRAAEAWFKELDAGVDEDKPVTVTDVCRDYVEHLESEKRGARANGDRRKDAAAVPGHGAAHDIEMRFKRYVYDAELGKTRLDKLRTKTLKKWRDELPGSKDSQNRNWAALRAALNLAVTNRRVSAERAIEWKSVKQHKNAKRRRDLYLDRDERRSLLDKSEGAVRNLVHAAMLTGARPGELVGLKRSDFDARTETLKLTGKTGTRRVPLAPAAVEFFKGVAKDKLPAAQLLPADDGKPWPHSGWDEGIKAAAKAAKLPAGVVLYTLRHSWITEALRGGMSTLDVARLTGTSLPMIERHYGHLVQDSARERLKTVQML